MQSSTFYHDEENTSSSDEEEIEQELEMDEGSDEEESDDPDIHMAQTPSKGKGKGKIVDDADNRNIIVQTAFDAYFIHTASRIQTSANVYSQLVLPLTAEEYAEGIASATKRLTPLTPSLLEGDSLKGLFGRFIFELNQGFNLLCYGFGSKRDVLNQFASEVCCNNGHVVVANAFQPDFTIKDLLLRIHSLPPVQSLVLGGTVERQATEISEYFSKQKHHLYLVIHNIDASALRPTRSKTVLSMLASSPRIHLVGSVDHINAPLLWSASELSAREPNIAAPGASSSARGFAWLWHDLTTLAPYDAELSFANRSSISGASSGSRRKGDAGTSQNPTAMSETAASHILASVTQKAKKLFVLLGTKQLESIDDAGDKAINDLQQYGMVYNALFGAARDDFIAVNDTALRSLLGEFRDHGLVLSAPSGTGTETLWIPLPKERLQSVLDALDPSS